MLSSCKKEEEFNDDMLPAVKVKLLNGCGFSGIASEFSEYLSQYNIYVVSLGNSEKPIYDKTIIVIKQDDEEDLMRLKKYTGITRVIYALDPYIEESFQIILGRDYQDYIKN
jgi:hypothetical protein